MVYVIKERTKIKGISFAFHSSFTLALDTHEVFWWKWKFSFIGCHYWQLMFYRIRACTWSPFRLCTLSQFDNSLSIISLGSYKISEIWIFTCFLEWPLTWKVIRFHFINSSVSLLLLLFFCSTLRIIYCTLCLRCKSYIYILHACTAFLLCLSGSSRQFTGFGTDVEESIINCIWERAGVFLPTLRDLPLLNFFRSRKIRVGLRPYSKLALWVFVLCIFDGKVLHSYWQCEFPLQSV